MSLSKSKCWYSNNCLRFLKHAVSLKSNRIGKSDTFVAHVNTFLKDQRINNTRLTIKGIGW